MKVSFSVIWDGQRVEFRLAGRQTANGLLTLCRQNHFMVAVLGKLLYRGDLANRIGLAQHDELNDAALALKAYQSRGVGGIAALEGIFAVVVWDGRSQRVISARDPMGGYPLYWTARGGRWGVATCLVSLCREFPGGELDPEYVADYLMLPFCGQNEVRSDRTPFQGIHRVPPGHLVTADESTGDVEVRSYWNWLNHTEDPGTDRVEEIARGYADRLRRAVREGVGTTTAAHLSGGMDSTSVCMLAKQALGERCGHESLHTISLVYDRMRVLARERSLIERLTRDHDGMVPHYVEGDGLLNFDCYADPPPHDEPWPWLSAAEVECARTDVAARIGASVVLTGHGADEMADVGPYHITDLLRRGRVLRAWGVAIQAARAENCSVWSILHPFGLINVMPPSFREGFGPALRGGYSGWAGMGEDTVPPWIRPEFARSHQLRERGLDHTREVFYACRPTVLSVARAKILNRTGDMGRWHLSTHRGSLLYHPFLDTRLLKYCLGIHARFDPLPRGQPKPLLADAMKGILPEEIRTRPKAGFFNEPYFRGIAKHLPELEALVRETPADDLGFLNRQSLIECLQQSALGIGNARVQLDRMNLTLSMLRWLSLYKSWYDGTELDLERFVQSHGNQIDSETPGCPRLSFAEE